MSDIYVSKINYDDVLHIATHMRLADRDEIFATRFDDRAEALALSATAVGGIAVTFGKDEPIAAIGAYEAWPHFWTVWMFATDRFKEVSLTTTRFVKRVIIPALEKAEYRRAECHSHSEHFEAHAWLEYLGARRESVCPLYGRNGETFYRYVWLKE